MNIKERFLNSLDGVLLALAMAWTVTIASALLYPNMVDLRASTEQQAALSGPAGDL
jgi:hypothetical protein